MVVRMETKRTMKLLGLNIFLVFYLWMSEGKAGQVSLSSLTDEQENRHHQSCQGLRGQEHIWFYPCQVHLFNENRGSDPAESWSHQ